eukprot:g7946.t1
MVPNVGTDKKHEAVVEGPDPAAPPAEAEATDAPVQTPAPSEKHVLNCQFGQWQPLFKHCTPRSVVLDLPEDVVRYLQEDGVVLPKGFEMSCGQGLQGDSDDEVDWGNEEEEDGDDDNRPDFPGLHTQLSEAIASLGGAVFPKLNWSCPKDAAWVNGGSLKCSLPGDVLCLLKSSTFISHDLSHAFDACNDATVSRPGTFTLVLRKWCNLHPSMLFRCFVRDRRLVGVCQRDCTSYYGFLVEEADRLSGLLEDFFAAEVCKKFPDPECVADVYVDNRSRVWLLDINPFSAVTDSLLFDWSEDALAAPLPPAAPQEEEEEEEALPPGVFVRVHFDPAPPSLPPPTGGDSAGDLAAVAAAEAVATAAESNPKNSACCAGGAGEVGQPGNLLAGATGFTLAGGEGRGFELRCVPSSLHMVPDPMGRYRGPADVGMGTLMCGTGGSGGLELEDLIESCRLADKES